MKRLLRRYQELSKPLKAAFWFTICNFLLKGISFIVMPIFTRIMPTEEYGAASVFLSYNSIFLIFATFELALGAYQRGILIYKDDLYTFEQTIVFLSNVITVIFFLIVLICWKPFEKFTGISLVLFGVMTLNWITYTPYNCWLNKKRFEYDYRPAVAITLLLSIVSNVVSILCLYLVENTAEVKMVTFFAVNMLFGLPFWLRNLNVKNFIKHWKEITGEISFSLKFQVPLVFHSLSYYVLDQSDRVMIGAFVGGKQAAYYSVSYSLASVIIIFQSSLNQVFRPWRYQKLENKDYSQIRSISNALIVMVSGVILLFALIVPDVLRIAFPPEYYEGIHVMAPVTFGVYFLFLYSIFVDIESYYGKTKYVAYTSVICAVLNVLLNYLGIKFFGYVACAYTTMICYILMAILHYVFMKKTCREANVELMPINIKPVIKISLGMMLAFFIVLGCYKNNIVRYSVFTFVLAIAISQHKKIQNIKKKKKKTK